MSDHLNVPWRVGRHVGRTVYAVIGDDRDSDTLIGLMDTRDLAAEVVEAHNQRIDASLFNFYADEVNREPQGPPVRRSGHRPFSELARKVNEHPDAERIRAEARADLDAELIEQASDRERAGLEDLDVVDGMGMSEDDYRRWKAGEHLYDKPGESS